MFKGNDPATSAPEAIVKMAETAKLPKSRQYDAATDHNHEYASGKFVDHESDAAREWAWRAVKAGGTKKEIQFAFKFHTPIDVTRAADAWGNKVSDTSHRKPRLSVAAPADTKAEPVKATARKAEGATVTSIEAAKKAPTTAKRTPRKATAPAAKVPADATK